MFVEMKPGRSNKRPRSPSDDEERSARPEVDEGDGRTVTEEQVEEFYAILRRMREVSRVFAVRNGNGRVGGRRRGGAAPWVPAFKLEDFEEGGAVRVNGTETPTRVAGTGGGERRGWTEVEEDDWTSGSVKPDSTAPLPSSRP